MREILFRGKRLDNGELVTGGSIIQFLDDGIQSFYMPQFNEKCSCEHDSISDNIESFTDCKFYKINPETVDQYTGLKDINDNMIFEGDICIIIARNIDEDYGCYFIVKYDIETARFVLESETLCVDFDNVYEYECEIIGNVYDNSELLRGE